MLENTLESPLDCKGSQTNQSILKSTLNTRGRTDAKAQAPILWPPDAKREFTGKDPIGRSHWKDAWKK